MKDLFSFLDAAAQDSLKKIAPFLLLFAALVIYIPGSANLPLLDRDEPRFSEATVEMIDRGEWVIPYFNGNYRFDKPALVYWLMRVGYILSCVSELGARLHSIVCVYLVAVVIYCIGLRFFTAQTGLLAGLGWLTCFQTLVHGRLAVADMPMILFVVLAHWGLMELLLKKNRPPWGVFFWVTWLSLGLGFLTKGPIALLVPLLSVLGCCFVFRKKQHLYHRQLQLLPGLALTFFLIACWGIPALVLTKGAFWDVGIGTHVVERGLDAFNGRVPIPGYYFVSAFFSLFPWIAFGVRSYGNCREPFDATAAFLAAWLLNPYFIFLFYKTQLPHYVMPGFAAFFLLLFRKEPDSWCKAEKICWYSVMALWSLILLILVEAAVFFPFSGSLAPLSTVLLALIALVAAMYITSLAVFFRWKVFGRTDVLLFCCIIIIAGSFQVAANELRKINPAIAIKNQIGVPKDVKKIAYGFTEPSLVFYTGERWVFNPDVPIENVLKEENDSPYLVLFLSREWKLDRYVNRLFKGQNPLVPNKDNSADAAALTSIAKANGYKVLTFSGVNVGTSSWAEVAAFVRK